LTIFSPVICRQANDGAFYFLIGLFGACHLKLPLTENPNFYSFMGVKKTIKKEFS